MAAVFIPLKEIVLKVDLLNSSIVCISREDGIPYEGKIKKKIEDALVDNAFLVERKKIGETLIYWSEIDIVAKFLNKLNM